MAYPLNMSFELNASSDYSSGVRALNSLMDEVKQRAPLLMQFISELDKFRTPDLVLDLIELIKYNYQCLF